VKVRTSVSEQDVRTYVPQSPSSIDRKNLFTKKHITINKYNGWLPERVLTPSKLAAYVNLNSQTGQ